MFPSEKPLFICGSYILLTLVWWLFWFDFFVLFCFYFSFVLFFSAHSVEGSNYKIETEWRQQTWYSRLYKVYQTQCRNSHMCFETLSTFLIDYQIHTSELPFLFSTQSRSRSGNLKFKEADRTDSWQNCYTNL